MIAVIESFEAKSIESYNEYPKISLMSEIRLVNEHTTVESIDIEGLREAVRQAVEKFCKTKSSKGAIL